MRSDVTCNNLVPRVSHRLDLQLVACRAGEIFSCERSHRKKFFFHLELFRQWKTGERKKVLPRGWTIGKRKDRGGGGAKKISPARGHCSFRKLRSPTNGVSDWCGSTLSVNCLSITSQIIHFVRQRNTANSVVSGVVSSILLSRNLLTFYVNLDTGFGKASYFRRSYSSSQHWPGTASSAVVVWIYRGITV